MKKILKFNLLVFLFALSFNMYSQELLEEISLQEQVEDATTIVEGMVIAKQSFWDKDYKRIYTVNTFEVTKVFKGDMVSKVNVVTMGGTVDDSFLIVSPSLSLNVNDIGLIALKEYNLGLTDYDPSKGKLYKPSYMVQSFYKYDLLDDKVINTFATKAGVSTFNLEIEKLTGVTSKKVSSVKKDLNVTKTASSQAVLAPSNISFSPSSIGAGSQSQLTITGSGFGNSNGLVFFKDPDNGGRSFVSAPGSHIISWSDTRIVLEVPSKAGTGFIRVRNSDGQEAESVNSLFVPYSLTNLGGNSVQHFDINGSGGLTWRLNTELFENKPAYNAVLRAIDTWRCETGINWVIGENTDIDETRNDNINVVSFGDLPRPSIGITSVYGTTCTGDVFLITDVDVIMRSPDTSNWNFGPEPTSRFNTDFESTFLHELGHAHLLGHVINSTDLMNFSTTNGQDIRGLGVSNIAGAGIIMEHSTSRRLCRGQDLVEPFSCPTNSVEDAFVEQSLSVYPNPNNGTFFIKGDASLNLERASIFDVSGRLISEVDLTESSIAGVTTVDVSSASKGLYFVNVYFNNTMIVKKILIK